MPDSSAASSVRERVLTLVKREYYCAAHVEHGPEALTDLIIEALMPESEHPGQSEALDALKWKRAALKLHERLCAAHYGLAHRHTMPVEKAAARVEAVLLVAINSFEHDYPPDDPEAGWNLEDV